MAEMNHTVQRASLREGSLTFIEVLATSIALIGPSMTPLLIAPYMYALAGNGTWLAYVFGGTMLVFVALCVNQFASRSSAAGSMYQYIADHLGPTVGAIGGWALLWAYGFVAAAVLGAMALFVGLLLDRFGVHAPPTATAAVLAVIAWQAAYRGVQVSAIVMLVLEAISVGIICLVVALILHSHGPSLDSNQLHLRGAIPRAVIGSVLFASAFFVIVTYAEIVGLSHSAKPLDQQTFPLGTLVDIYGIPELRIPITVGALFSAFSVCLACITTAGRIAYAMANAQLLPSSFARIEPRHGTPNIAVTVVTAVTLAVAAIALWFGVAPIDVFNNCGTLSSFGFILIYMLIAIAALVYTKRLGAMRAIDMSVSLLALVFLIVPAITLFYPVPAPPQRWFGYYFLAFVAAGWLWFSLRVRKASG